MYNMVPLSFTCSCGKATHLCRAGVASGYRMSFEWRCGCGKANTVLMAFEELANNVPEPPQPEITEFDKQFCAQAHISLQESLDD